MTHADTDTTVVDRQPDDPQPDDDLLDEEWLSSGQQRSRWRIALVVMLGVSLVFLAGVQVQKQFGTSSSDTAAAGGFPAGGLPSGGLPEGFPDLGSGAGPGTAPDAGTDTGTDDGTTAVIGTVTKVDGDTWIVTDLGGTKHTVTVGKDTTVLTESSVDEADVAEGTTVSISGSGDSDDLTATTITVR